ncbi:MAG: thioether cross-link-forming SCIFF peptide maturase, partial [Limnochordia bacterium]
AWDEIEALEQRGQLYGDDSAWRNWQPEPTGFKALCLNVAHNCNLACRYCFATTDEDLMPLEVAIKAVDWLVANSQDRKVLEVDFFGGEPLLNWPVVQGVVEYAQGIKDKTFNFTLTTNGVLLTPDKMAYLNEANIGVVLSIDGRREIHDRMRPPAHGRYSSYERILPAFLEMARSRNHENYYVRGTFTSANLDFTEDVAHLADLGFQQISLEPVVLKDVPYALTEEHLPQICREYERLTELLLAYEQEGRTVDFFHFKVDLFTGPCLPKRLTSCGAGFEYLAVTPGGDFYPCHQFIGREGFRLGNVADGRLNETLVEEFRQAHLFNKESCPSCWARYYCGGGCHANAHLFNGDIHKPYQLGCDLHKKRLECSLYLQSRRHGAE